MASFTDILTTPGAQLVGHDPIPSISDKIIGWIGDGLVILVHASPEIFGIVAMCLLLGGMVGSSKCMKYAGTSVLLAIAGVMISAALS